MKTSITLAAITALILLCLSPLSAQSKSTKLSHQTEDKNAPVVYFTRDVSAAGLMKVYNALNQKNRVRSDSKFLSAPLTKMYLILNFLQALLKQQMELCSTPADFQETDGLRN